jgi:hypothetical protein
MEYRLYMAINSYYSRTSNPSSSELGVWSDYQNIQSPDKENIKH